MKQIVAIMLLTVVLSGASLYTARAGHAEEVKMVGVITSIQIAGKDAKVATVTLKDNETEQSVTVTVTDDLTLDKFKDHRIVEGDEIRLRYEKKDGKGLSTYFRKTAGC